MPAAAGIPGPSAASRIRRPPGGVLERRERPVGVREGLDLLAVSIPAPRQRPQGGVVAECVEVGPRAAAAEAHRRESVVERLGEGGAGRAAHCRRDAPVDPSERLAQHESPAGVGEQQHHVGLPGKRSVDRAHLPRSTGIAALPARTRTRPAPSLRTREPPPALVSWKATATGGRDSSRAAVSFSACCRWFRAIEIPLGSASVPLKCIEVSLRAPRGGGSSGS